MINITRGKIENSTLSNKLVEIFEEKNDIDGNLFLGYPILPTTDDKIAIDALLISPQYGIIAIMFYNDIVDTDFEELQDEIYSLILSKIAKEKALVKRGKVLINLDVITYAPNLSKSYTRDDNGFTVCNTNDSFYEYLKSIEASNEQHYEYAMRCIQSIGTMKKVLSRDNVKTENSRGWILKDLEKHVANLDKMQMSAALEISENVQRIRGLAGSGKTIVLALKAAYIHVANPSWKIAVTFNTRSLKQQFIELITKFVYEQSESTPNWDNINIIHAWGSPKEEGIYYNFCKNHNVEYLDFQTARNMSSYATAFNYACKVAMQKVHTFSKMYDVILIDEAQDFSSDFLRLCYEVLPAQKRLVYAYDELQSLTVNSMDTPENIFGYKSNGSPNVVLKNEKNQPREDIILNVCYRNSRPVLSSAHALGFRIYGEIAQMFDDANLWTEIGYEVESGKLEDDNEVVLKRTSESSPRFLEEHSPIDDLIVFRTVEDEEEQAKWVASEIKRNLENDELEYKDILVIHTDPLQTKRKVGMLRTALYNLGINSHLAGVTTSPDEFFMEDSITFTSIFRAKGNEAAMVYIIDGQNCGTDYATAQSRNILFTAITRSRAWVRVVGYGDRMNSLCDEFQKIKDNDFRLDFVYPNKKLREKLNIIHRDKSQYETEKIEKSINSFEQIINDIENGFMYKEDIPENLWNKLKGLFSNE